MDAARFINTSEMFANRKYRAHTIAVNILISKGQLIGKTGYFENY